MRISLTHFTPLVITAAAAVAVVAAPLAGAAPTAPHSCLVVHSTPTCQRPRIVEITLPRPSVAAHPYATTPFLTGGH